MIDVISQHLEDIRALCREYGVVQLDIFGSATREDFDPQRSDIDLLVEFAPSFSKTPKLLEDIRDAAAFIAR